MDVLAIVHGDKARSGIFGDVVAERGHTLEEWSIASGEPPPQPLDAYGATIVFGGAMHADQDAHHPWLRDENFILARLLDLGMPLLGVCLGAQLIAKATHAPVMPASEPEIGWYDVELTEEATGDPIFERLPDRFRAFQWHYYTHGLPAGAEELARSRVCTQAFRIGERAWGVQFHPEVTEAQIGVWLAEEESAPVDADALTRETRERIAEWNSLGVDICGAFCHAAERAGALV